MCFRKTLANLAKISCSWKKRWFTLSKTIQFLKMLNLNWLGKILKSNFWSSFGKPGLLNHRENFDEFAKSLPQLAKLKLQKQILGFWLTSGKTNKVYLLILYCNTILAKRSKQVHKFSGKLISVQQICNKFTASISFWYVIKNKEEKVTQINYCFLCMVI